MAGCIHFILCSLLASMRRAGGSKMVQIANLFLNEFDGFQMPSILKYSKFAPGLIIGVRE